jgi:hypothetical protein
LRILIVEDANIAHAHRINFSERFLDNGLSAGDGHRRSQNFLVVETAGSSVAFLAIIWLRAIAELDPGIGCDCGSNGGLGNAVGIDSLPIRKVQQQRFGSRASAAAISRVAHCRRRTGNTTSAPL